MTGPKKRVRSKGFARNGRVNGDEVEYGGCCAQHIDWRLGKVLKAHQTMTVLGDLVLT